MSRFRTVYSFLLFVNFVQYLHCSSRPETWPDTAEISKADESMTIFRLPTDTEPISYRLKLTPLLETELILSDKVNIPKPSKFEGEMSITIYANKATKTITLHAADLTIKTAAVYKESGIAINVQEVKQSPENQLVFINLVDDLVFGNNYVVVIPYTGVHNNDMKGFYQSVYPLKDKMRILAATQFESTFARLAFPCYDEPAYKTPFTVIITIPDSLKAISNMPVKNKVQDQKLQKTTYEFETTPPIPTYLVAFIVSSFEQTNTNERTAVYAREDAIDQTKFIAEKAPQVLKSLEGLTGVKYDLPKLDIVAIPDFAAGAMENYGLTTYRESRVLVNSLSTTRQTRLVLEVVAHEFAHQWFGDLITPLWWDSVWLNEAFATYYEYAITSMVQPTWRIRDFFIIDELQTALNSDGNTVHRPMTNPVQSPKEISSQFDVIIYEKGGSILRMLEHSITKPVFNKAISKYIERGVSKKGKVTPENFYDALEDTVLVEKALPNQISVLRMMKSWTEQVAYPLVTVIRDYSKKTVTFSQTVYQHDAKPKSKDALWIIPITFATKEKPNFQDTKPSVWLSEKTRTESLPISETSWLIFNLQQTGYYRVNYDTKNWELLIKQLKTDPSEINVLNRAQLIDDSFHLAKDNVISYNIPFELAGYLDRESDIIPWQSAIKIFTTLRNMAEGTDVKTLLDSFVSERISPLYNKLGMVESVSDDFVTKIARSVIISAACTFNHYKCVSDAKDIMAEWIKSDKKKGISPDVMSTVFCTAVRYRSDDDWKIVQNYYVEQASVSSSLAEIVLPALGCTTNVNLLQSLLEIPFSNKLPYRAQNNRYIFEALSKPKGIQAGLDVIEKQIPSITADKKSELKVLLNMITTIGKHASTDDHVKRLKSIKESDKLKTAPTEVKNVLEEAHTNAATNNGLVKKNLSLIKAQLVPKPEPKPEPEPKPAPPSSSSSPLHDVSFLAVFLTSCFLLFTIKFVAKY